jgi:hypothetical protein
VTVNIADPKLEIGGDWLTAADLNGDTRVDFVAANFASADSILHVSSGPTQWKDVKPEGELLPLMSYYAANTSGMFSSKKRPDAVISYTRSWPSDLDSRILAPPPHAVTTNIDRLTFTKDGLKREPIMRWGGREGIWGLASGDFDGDGNDDVMFTRQVPREVGVLLGDGKGGFTQASIEGINLELNPNYDLKIADVNRDKKPDVILMYETGGTTALADRDGRIQVFLNGGAVAATTAAKE